MKMQVAAILKSANTWTMKILHTYDYSRHTALIVKTEVF